MFFLFINDYYFCWADGYYDLMDINLFDVVSTTFGVDKSKKKTRISRTLHGSIFHGFFSLILFCQWILDSVWILKDLEHYGARCFQTSSLLWQWVLPITSAPSRSQTHPNLPQGKEQVTLLCQRLVQSIISAPSRSPPKGRCRLLRFCHRLVVQFTPFLS